MIETELKLIVSAEVAKETWARAVEAGLAASAPRSRLLRSIYYDTPGRSLREAGFALRMRRDGRRWIQTVKARPGIHGGLSQVEEWEAPAPGGRMDLDLIDEDAVREAIADLTVGEILEPVCETLMRRASGSIAAADGVRADLAVDLGEIIAGERRAPLCEVEIELLDGPLGGLFEIAKTLFPSGGVRFSHDSKAARGFRLAAGGEVDAPVAPRKAKAVALRKSQTAEEAARDVLRECVEMIAANVEAVRTLDDVLGPHQLRVALRRLRSVVSSFRDALQSPETDRLALEAQWLGAEVGRLRDLDVAAGELVAREAASFPHEPGFATLAGALEERKGEERERLRAILGGERTQAFVFDLSCFAETRGWLRPEDIGQTARLAAPVRVAMADALDRCWEHSSKRARNVADLEIEARHDLRKSLKRLRYTVDYGRPVFKQSSVLLFLKKLKKLQNVFGYLNDVAMAEVMFTGSESVAPHDPDTQRAVGLILGVNAARSEAAWTDAARLWDELNETKRFWT